MSAPAPARVAEPHRKAARFGILNDFAEALGNLRAQKTRTLLTALGIVFGVGSVIGMLSIGAGAREQSLRFIERLGVRNILVDSRPAATREEFQQRRRVSPGLTERDVRVLESNIDALETLSPRGSCTRRACCRNLRAASLTCSACARHTRRSTICGRSRGALSVTRTIRQALRCARWD